LLRKDVATVELELDVGLDKLGIDDEEVKEDPF
jgi:hypothetical protein